MNVFVREEATSWQREGRKKSKITLLQFVWTEVVCMHYVYLCKYLCLQFKKRHWREAF